MLVFNYCFDNIFSIWMGYFCQNGKMDKAESYKVCRHFQCQRRLKNTVFWGFDDRYSQLSLNFVVSPNKNSPIFSHPGEKKKNRFNISRN